LILNYIKACLLYYTVQDYDSLVFINQYINILLLYHIFFKAILKIEL